MWADVFLFGKLIEIDSSSFIDVVVVGVAFIRLATFIRNHEKRKEIATNT